MSNSQKPIIPPQKELKEELRKLGRAGLGAGCPRCGEPGQRLLRRCPKCGRRSRRMRTPARFAGRIPGNW